MTMEFATARDYRVHLRTMIDDYQMVEKIVRAKFPPDQRVIGLEQFKDTGKKAPSKYDPWLSSEASDRLADKAVATGSHALLKAIWRSHPAILERLAGQGLHVVQP